MKIPIPKQHGAWGMLYVPFMTAVLCSKAVNAMTFLAFFFLTVGFVLQESLLGVIRMYPLRDKNPERFSFLKKWAILFAALLLLLAIGLVIFFSRPYVLFFSAFAGLILGLHVYQKKERHDRNVSGEFLSVLGLTLSAPLTWYLLSNQFDRFAIVLWLFNILYFTSSIFYVKLRVSRVNKKNRKSIAWQCGLYHILLFVFLFFGLLSGRFPLFVLLAFVPIVIRSFWTLLYPAKGLDLRKIGFAEVAFSVIFLLLLVYGLRPGL